MELGPMQLLLEPARGYTWWFTVFHGGSSKASLQISMICPGSRELGRMLHSCCSAERSHQECCCLVWNCILFQSCSPSSSQNNSVLEEALIGNVQPSCNSWCLASIATRELFPSPLAFPSTSHIYLARTAPELSLTCAASRKHTMKWWLVAGCCLCRTSLLSLWAWEQFHPARASRGYNWVYGISPVLCIPQGLLLSDLILPPTPFILFF